MNHEPGQVSHPSTQARTPPHFPAPGSFQLHGDPIDDIRDSSQCTRILGVHWSMDGHYRSSLDFASTALTTSLSLLKQKFVPGKLAIHLINTVILPKLTYPLQLTPVPGVELARLDTTIRKVAKQKCYLFRNNHTSILLAPLAQYKLRELQLQLPKIKLNTILSQICSTHNIITSPCPVPSSPAP